MIEQKQIFYKHSTINYSRWGSGPKTVLCFHGYGEDISIFSFLDNHVDNQSTFYSIDLPFHGKTVWNEGFVFTAEDLYQIIEAIVNKSDFEATLIGFSLGGRVALSFLQTHPEKVEKLVLLAPDGLKINFWYWLATQTRLGNRFFAFTLRYPGWFFGFLKLLNKMKLVNASIFKFVNYYIGDAAVRQLLYQRWTTLRKLKPDLTIIKLYIKKENILVRLIYGKHDRIILSSVGEKFKKGIEEQCILRIIPSGHQVLHEKHAEEIIAALLH